MRFSFEEFGLDTTTYELRHGGNLVRLEPQVFDVLVFLITHRGRVVPKEELLDAVWGDRFVSESALTSRIKDARHALGDDGQRQHFIKTSHGRGYRFVAEVVEVVEVAKVIEALDADRATPVGPGAPRVGSPATGPSVAAAGLPHVPAERTPLFGRQEAIEKVTALLGEHRLVSLLGIGGTGKTRLAAATAAVVADRFAGGVCFIDLVPARDVGSVETAVAHGAGLGLSTGEARAQLARMIADRPALLVLDNCEHVRDEAAALLDHLLEHTTAPRFLVTSRAPLDLPDERRVVVGPLAVGGPSAPAVELFVSAAERFGATVEPGELAVVERICAGLDGLPLAIELAAAQLRLLRPAEVAARLDQRFELLQTRARPGRERHASLMTVLEATWGLLDDEERELLGRLAALPGPFDVADAEQLSRLVPLASAPGPATRVLGQLVDHSLVVGAADDTGDNRFRLLESVRLFTRDRTDTTRHADGHAAWCSDQVGTDLDHHLFDYGTAAWCARHYDDLREAERHLRSTGRPADAAMLVAATALATHLDAGARAADLLAGIDPLLGHVDDPALAARLHFVAVMAGMATRSPKVISTHGERGIAAARDAADPVLLAVALVLGSWSVVFSDRPRAVEMVEQASDLAGAEGSSRVRNLADAYRSFHLALMRRYDDATDQAEAVIARVNPDLGYEYDVAATLLASSYALSDPGRALEWVRHLLGRMRPDNWMWANQVLAAAVHASSGDGVRALAAVEIVQARLARAERDGLPDLLVPAAAYAHRVGDDERAARWLRAVRDAGRPTQSFQVTVVYRRLREAVGIAETSPLGPATLDDVGDEAISWMRAATTGSGSQQQASGI